MMILSEEEVNLPSSLSTTFILTILITSVNANFTCTSGLYRKLFTDLDSRIHPSLNASVPTNVTVQLNLLSLREIVETEQYFVMNAWMEFSWQDEMRTWDPSEYDGTRFIYPGPLGMWKPRVIVANSITTRDPFEDDYATLSLSFDGSASWYPGAVFYISCTMDMTYFPFDRQTCEMRVLAYEYATDVTLIPATAAVNARNYGKNGEWDLESTSAESRTINYKNVQFPRIVYTFHFRRRPAFYLMNVLVPVVLMSLLSPLVFMLPEESGERVSYAVTLLLSLSVFMGIVAGQLPQSSNPFPLCVIYLFMMLIHSGLCVVCSVAHLRWEKYKLEDNDGNMSDNPELINQTERQQQQSLESSSLQVDHKQMTQAGRTSLENGFPNQHAIIYKNKILFKANRYNENLDTNLNSDQQNKDKTKNKNRQVENLKVSSSRKSRMSCYYFWKWNANTMLLLFFYFSWFVISGYFLLKFSL